MTVRQGQRSLRIELNKEETEELEKTGSVVFEKYAVIKKDDVYYLATLTDFERILLNHED